MRSTLTASLVLVAAVGCSGGGVKTLHVSAMGKTSGLVRGGDHVAYLVNIQSGLGGTGELHVADVAGVDIRVASGIAAQGYVLSPDGTALLYTQINSGNMDASLYWLDVTKGGSPKQLFAHGLRVTANNPKAMASGFHTLPLLQQGFFTPSGKYFAVGVLAPGVASSADMHVIETATGNDIFQRANGAFAYLELALPDDTMIFQDSNDPLMAPGGPPAVEQLYYVKLPSASGMSATTIDQRVAQFVPTPDNKFLIYQRTNRDLLSWDTGAKPATGTMLATGAVQFAVSAGTVAWSTGDGGLHLSGVDGSKKVDIGNAGADPFSPLVLSSDGSDLYYFQKVETQDARGTLMHVAAGGGTPSKIADKSSLFDVRPVPGALLYLTNVDDKGTIGDAFKAGRDGSGGSALGTGVPIGGLTTVVKDGNWFSPHLVSAAPNPMQTLVDGTTTTTGGLELTTMAGDQKLDTATRAGQFYLADDNSSIVWLGDLKLDSTVNNYVGKLKWEPVAMPPMMPNIVTLDSVSEITPVTKRSYFANSTSTMTPAGVYYVTY